MRSIGWMRWGSESQNRSLESWPTRLRKEKGMRNSNLLSRSLPVTGTRNRGDNHFIYLSHALWLCDRFSHLTCSPYSESDLALTLTPNWLLPASVVSWDENWQDTRGVDIYFCEKKELRLQNQHRTFTASYASFFIAIVLSNSIHLYASDSHTHTAMSLLKR